MNAPGTFRPPYLAPKQPPAVRLEIMVKRKRYKGDIRAIQRTTTGYFVVSVPANLIRAMGWGKGQPVRWRVRDRDRLELWAVDESDPGTDALA